MFYERFLELCKKSGVKPSVVAKEIGLSNAAPTYWKNGSVPKASTIQAIAEYFGASVDYLLGKDDFPFPDLSGQTMTFTPTTPEERSTLAQLFSELEGLTDADKEILLSMAKQLNNARKKSSDE